MGRTPRPYTSEPKVFKKRDQHERYAIKDPQLYLKRLLIYYPKKLQVLKLIIIEMYNLQSNLELKKLYNRVISRYKKEFLKSLDISPFCNNFPLWRKGGEAQNLNIRDIPYYLRSRMKTSIPLRYVIKLNKRIKNLRLDERLPVSANIFRQLKYLPSLSSIEINKIPLMDKKHQNRFFQGSKFSIKSITFTSSPSYPVDEEDFAPNKKAVIQFFRLILELPCLRKIDFSSVHSYTFNIKNIPFNILRKRNISYIIQVTQNSEVSLSTPNRVGLGNLEFLGIKFKDPWLNQSPRWDIYYEDYLKTRGNCKRVLLLNLYYPKEIDLLDLCLVCKNITTFEITLSYRNTTKGISFANLKNLPNLRNVFIELSSINKQKQVFREGKIFYEEERTSCSEDLFRSLALCAQTLKSVHLYLYGEALTEPEDDVLTFFDACADTLIHFTLKFSFEPSCKPKDISMFYKGLSRLKRVECMKIIYDKFDWRSSFSHSKYLKKVLSNKSFLQEFYLHAPSVSSKDILIDYEKLNEIDKLSFHFWTLDGNSKFLKKSTKFSTLRYLELRLKTTLNIFENLLKALNRMQKLEVLFLNWQDWLGEPNNSVISSLDLLFGNNSSLRFIAFGSSLNSADIKIFVKQNWMGLPSVQDVDNFFGRYLQALPKKRNQKIFLCLKK